MNQIRLLLAFALLTTGVACKRSTNGQDGTAVASDVTTLALTVDGTGYHPDKVTAPAGRPVRLSITRTADDGCGQQIVFPALNIRKDLPLNRAVQVDFTMPASGSLAFACGMDMMRGSIVAE